MKNFSREILTENREFCFNPMNGLKRVLDARRTEREVKRYGSVEERQRAYFEVRESFAKFFAANPDKIGQKASQPSEAQISFDWLGTGQGIISRIGEDYIFYTITNPYDFGYSILGERFRRDHSLIEINGEGAQAKDWEETSIQPPIVKLPFISETRSRTMLLTAQEASDLALIVHTEYIIPNFDSLFVDKDPRSLN